MANKLWYCLAAVLLGTFAISNSLFAANTSDSATKTDNLDIVFIGNSITYGATLSSPGTQAPPVRVKEILSTKIANDVSISNCGHSGSTTLDWMPGTNFMNQALNAGHTLQNDGGNLFFSIMLGTNDSAEKGPNGSPVSPENYKKNITTIINKLFSEFPDARIILNYPLWYSPNTHNGATYMQAGLNRLNSYHPIINEVLSEMQGADKKIYAGSTEAYSFFMNNKPMFTAEGGYDGTFYLHPNKEGAVKLAEFWANSILEHAQDIVVNEADAVQLKQLISGAEEKAASIYARTPGLVDDWHKITTNASGNDNPNIPNNLANMIDGNRNTTYQTWPSYPATGYSYLQFDLSATPVNSVYIDIAPWQNGEYGVADMPKKVKFALSADGGATWDKEIDYTIDLKAGFSLSDTYKSPLIEFGGTYNTVKMIMIEHQYDRNATHPKLFGFSMFQMYALKKNAPCYDPAVKAAGDALAAAAALAKTEFSNGNYGQEQIAALQQAIATFDKAMDDFNEANNIEEKLYSKGSKLITRASQLSTNCEPLGQFSLANLIDGNDQNIYHSWAGPARPEKCWIQVNLDKPLQRFYLTYIPHKYRSWALVEQDNPSKITVLASKDNINWTQALVLDASMGMPTEYDKNYDSPLLNLGDEYQYLRFRIDNTLGNRADGNSVIVTLAEMQLYEAKKNVAPAFELAGNTLVCTGDVDAAALTQAIADNPTALSIDLTQASLNGNITTKLLTSTITGNQLIFLPAASTMIGKNIVRGTKSTTLALTDGYDFGPAIDFTASKVTYTRQIADNKWSTLVLPFPYTVPEGIIFAHNPVIEDDMLLLEQYEVGETVPAGQPVMIKADAPTTLTLEAKSNGYKAEYTAEELTDNNIFTGTFKTITPADTTNAYTLDQSALTFTPATAGATLPAFRAYLILYSASPQTITISDDLTAIHSTTASTPAATKVYTTDGKLIRTNISPIDATKNLPQGTYIINGQKYTVK